MRVQCVVCSYGGQLGYKVCFCCSALCSAGWQRRRSRLQRNAKLPTPLFRTSLAEHRCEFVDKIDICKINMK